jgi:Ca-activated chloride channel family protein
VVEPALTATWARAHLRDLEDGYAVSPDPGAAERIVATSLRFSTLCRFTAFVAVDEREVIDPTGRIGVTQPVELPSGWASGPPAPAPMSAAGFAGTAPAPGTAVLRTGLSRAMPQARSLPTPPPPADLDVRLDEELARVRALTFPLLPSQAVLRSAAVRDLAAASGDAGRPSALVEALERLAKALADRDQAEVRAALQAVGDARTGSQRKVRFWR